MPERIPSTNLDNIDTWVKYKSSYCSHCMGSCCSLEIEATFSDLVRMGLADAFEAQESAKKIAKRLMKQGVVEHFNGKTGRFSIARLSNDDCMYLDQHSRTCTIYDKRPDTCRNHPVIGPKPGYCAYRAK